MLILHTAIALSSIASAATFGGVKDQTVFIRVERDMYDNLRRIAERTETSVASVCRRLIRHGLDRTGGELFKPKKAESRKKR